ncbi:hypothetical protein C7417_3978 [Cupriavidus plantarum]|nr:hypothetical protein C7417_3978 [Cupriavidus plantarum]
MGTYTEQVGGIRRGPSCKRLSHPHAPTLHPCGFCIPNSLIQLTYTWLSTGKGVVYLSLLSVYMKERCKPEGMGVAPAELGSPPGTSLREATGRVYPLGVLRSEGHSAEGHQRPGEHCGQLHRPVYVPRRPSIPYRAPAPSPLPQERSGVLRDAVGRLGALGGAWGRSGAYTALQTASPPSNFAPKPTTRYQSVTFSSRCALPDTV